MLSNQEFNSYGGTVTQKPELPEPPKPYTKATRTTFGRATSWTRQPGMGISKQASGSFLSFDEDTPTAMPESDKGAGR